MLEEPFKTKVTLPSALLSKVCLVFRTPFTKPGLVIGMWNKNTEIVFEEDADLLLANALGARNMGLSTEEIDEW
jgi:hypothetical protein